MPPSTMLARYTLESPSYYTPLLRLELTGGTNRYPLLDGVGSTRRLMDGSGNITDFYDLEAFGVLRSQSGSTANPYRFGGGWGYITDPSGLQQLGARFYWPEIGRFIQQDPIGDGMNWYAYAGNNPVVSVDPEGLGPRDWLGHGLEALGAWIGDFLWPDNSDPHPGCDTGMTGDYAGAGGAALAIGGVTATGLGIASTAVGEAAAAAGGTSAFWSTAGTAAKVGGPIASIGGGVIMYADAKAKLQHSGGLLGGRLRDPTGTGEDFWGDFNKGDQSVGYPDENWGGWAMDD